MPHSAWPGFSPTCNTPTFQSPFWPAAKTCSWDWVGSALASQGAHPIPLFERYAQRMGPGDGPARMLVNGRGTSPYFAALVNGAASHLVEQDDPCTTARCCTLPLWYFPPCWPRRRSVANRGGSCCWRRWPATKRASASASSWAAPIIESSTPPPRWAPWPLQSPWANCWGSTASSSSTCWAMPAPRRPGSGNSCATPPTPSSCTPPRPPPMACSPPT